MAKEKKRTDSYRRVLKQGESQRTNGKYDYRWTDRNGKRHSVYADTLDELREINLLSGVERIDNYKVVQVYFRSSFSSEVTNLYEKFEKDLCVAIEDWFGAIETGYYYVLIK